MKINRLRLLGFKSFVEATDVVFENGLTGIVGPNGCGKSNLVEALRFVMGESSYKAMRGAGMDDVIFSGAANRPDNARQAVWPLGQVSAGGQILGGRSLKINRLRLLGFKSFVEATDVVFENGLTGIVGPNGCGKSNLVEALRFVMGESSYKAMRGAGMDDVIFSGAANRPARNTAEVTLFADPDGSPNPFGIPAGEDLQINRRIEREAGSAYRINGKDVRGRAFLGACPSGPDW